MATTRLLINLDANSGKLVSEMQRSRKAIDQMKGSVDSMRSSLSLIKIDSIVSLGRQAIQVGQHFYNSAKNLINWADDLQDMAKATGVTVGKMWELQYIANRLGIEQQQLNLGIRTFINNMGDSKKGTGEAAEAFKKAGISSDDLDTALLQAAKHISAMDDGTEKAGLSMKLFGSRAGLAMLELMDLGEEGIKKVTEHMRELGLQINENKVAQLTKLKDTFADFETVLKVFAVDTLPPIIEFFTKFYNILLAIGPLAGSRGAIEAELKSAYGWRDAAISAENYYNWQKKIYELQTKLYGIGPELARGGEKPKTKPGPPGGLSDEERKIIGEERTQYEKDYWEQIHKTWAIEDKLKDIEGDRAKQLADDMFPSMEIVVSIQEKMTKGVEELRLKLAEQKNVIEENSWEDWADGIIKADEGTQKFTQEIIKNTEAARIMYENLEDKQRKMDELGNDIASSLTSNMVMLMSSTDTWGDKFKKVGESILQMVLQIIVKQMVMNALFEESAGGKKTFLGGGSWIGSIIGGIGGLLADFPVRSYQGGGIASSPQIGIFGEGGGEEAFVPLRGGKIPVEGGEKGTNNITAFYIYANDPISFRDFVRRNPEAIIEVMHKSSREAGVMRGIIKNVG